MRQQVVVANERRDGVQPRPATVTDRHRLHCHADIGRTGQQSAMEGPQLAAIGGRPLGENHQGAAVLQPQGHFSAQALAVVGAAANEQGPCVLRQPSGDRPMAHLGLGQKRQRRDLPEQGDVGPGHMVADPQHRLLRHDAVDPHGERQGASQAAHETARPALAPRHRPGQPQSFADDKTRRQHQPVGHHQHDPPHTHCQTQRAHHTAARKWRA